MGFDQHTSDQHADDRLTYHSARIALERPRYLHRCTAWLQSILMTSVMNVWLRDEESEVSVGL